MTCSAGNRPLEWKVLNGQIAIHLVTVQASGWLDWNVHFFDQLSIYQKDFYIMDSGNAGRGGHTNLNSMPEVLGYYKLDHPQVGMPFVVGNRRTVSARGYSSKDK